MNTPNYTSEKDYTSGNNIQLVLSGKSYFDLLLQIIEAAKKVLYLQFYIFLNDQTGITVMGALKAAAQRNVAVFLHIDSYASKELPQECINDMRAAGVKVKLFEPLLRSRHFYFGRRLHHKVVVADGFYSLVGGINVCDRYNDMPGEPAWLDMALYCEGNASYTTENICKEMWNRKSFFSAVKNRVAKKSKNETGEATLVRVSRNDWVMRKMEIWQNYLGMFSNAQKSITIMCSYFLPGNLYRKKIQAAVRRGVEVKIILAGTSDITLSKHAERYLYDWLLRNNVTIYEYQETVLHAKVATYDGCWATVGSYNVNGLSAHASLEINMDVSNSAFAVIVEKKLTDIITQHCKQVTKENYASSTNIFRQFWQWVCYNVVNKMLFVVTFYFKQEK
jgi:cardiolipin synthase A/B